MILKKLKQKLAIRLARKYLPDILSRPCSNHIPRSGSASLSVDCYVVEIFDENKKPFMLVSSFHEDIVTGSLWDTTLHRYEQRASISLTEIDQTRFHIVHFYGRGEITYKSMASYVWGKTALLYFFVTFLRVSQDIAQAIYNSRQLVTGSRVQVLRAVLRTRLGGGEGISIALIAESMHGSWYTVHPQRVAIEHQLRFYLTSLVETNELRLDDAGNYWITGIGLSAIETVEEQDRKHRSGVLLQIVIVILTMGTVGLTAIQAKIFDILK